MIEPKAKTFHVCAAVSYVIGRARRPRSLDDLFTERGTGRAIPGEEAVSIAMECAAKGFTVIPSCDNHSPEGFCLGHEVPA